MSCESWRPAALPAVTRTRRASPALRRAATVVRHRWQPTSHGRRIVRGTVAATLALVVATTLPVPGLARAGAIASIVSVADFRTAGRTDAQAIQAAIDFAGPGDTVYFPGGVYSLD